MITSVTETACPMVMIMAIAMIKVSAKSMLLQHGCMDMFAL